MRSKCSFWQLFFVQMHRKKHIFCRRVHPDPSAPPSLMNFDAVIIFWLFWLFWHMWSKCSLIIFRTHYVTLQGPSNLACLKNIVKMFFDFFIEQTAIQYCKLQAILPHWWISMRSFIRRFFSGCCFLFTQLGCSVWMRCSRNYDRQKSSNLPNQGGVWVGGNLLNFCQF